MDTIHTAKSHMQYIMEGMGLPLEIWADVYNRLSENEARIVLQYLAYVQKDESFAGVSDLALTEALKDCAKDFPDNENIKYMSEMMNDFYNKEIAVLENRFNDGYYDMDDLEKREYHKFENSYYLYGKFEYEDDE